MQFSTAEGTWEVWDSQYDSREYYNKSVKLVEKERRLPQKNGSRESCHGVIRELEVTELAFIFW